MSARYMSEGRVRFLESALYIRDSQLFFVDWHYSGSDFRQRTQT
jgi:hypothetical protein